MVNLMPPRWILLLLFAITLPVNFVHSGQGNQLLRTEMEKRKEFNEVKSGLKKRLDILATLPLEKLNSMSLREIHTKA